MAGFLGPLAIFWLVMGYYQQRAELRQNTQALVLQYEELRESVVHQEVLAVSTADALEDARKDRLAALLPEFEITKGGYDLSPIPNVTKFTFTNIGESIKMKTILTSNNVGIVSDGIMEAESNWWVKNEARDVSVSLQDMHNGLFVLEFLLKNRSESKTVFDVLSEDVGNSREIRVIELRL